MQQTINTCDYCKEKIHDKIFKLKLWDGINFDLMSTPQYYSTIVITYPYFDADLCERCAKELNDELSRKFGKGRNAS